MKSRQFQGIILMLVSLLASSLLAHSGAAQGAKGGLRGQVMDPSGSTVAGATVLLTTPAGQSVDTTTGKDGSYEFKDLVPGKYTVKAVAEGFALFTQENATILPGQILKLNIAVTIEVQEQKVIVNDSST